MVAEEGTPVEAVEEIVGTAVGEGEDLITPEQISKVTLVSTQLAMVKWPLHCCKKKILLARYTSKFRLCYLSLTLYQDGQFEL